jgi:hypothetical protein
MGSSLFRVEVAQKSEPEYPAHFETRWVSKGGTFRFQSRQRFLSQALPHEWIGLEEVADGIGRCIATIDSWRAWTSATTSCILDACHPSSRSSPSSPSPISQAPTSRQRGLCHAFVRSSRLSSWCVHEQACYR